MAGEGPRTYRNLVEAILETAVDGIITIDEKGVVATINPAARRMFGYEAEDVVGKNISMLMPAPYRDEHDGYVARYLDTDEPRIIGIGREAVGRRKDGTSFPVELCVSEVRLGERRVFTGVVRDITAAKQAEEALRRERDFAESVIETAHAIVLVLDPEGRVVRFNRYMEELSGYTLDEIRGKDWFGTFLPTRDRSRMEALFREAVRGARVSGNINPICTRDGEEREIAWWTRTLNDGEGNPAGVLSVGHDMTELKEAQGRLMQAERLAGIGEMITGLAHESRNALQRMQACLEMLAMEVGEMPKAVDYLSRMQHAQDYLSQLYDEVRNYAAPIRLDRKTCDLRRLWGAAWADLDVARGDRPVELEDRTEGTDLSCSVDPFSFGQVFRNILENAITACPDGGRIAVLCDVTPVRVSLTFNDDGPGLSEQERERIFQPFFTTKTTGTGLGMAIVKRILEAHGGRIELGSGPLEGAAVVVSLPRSGP